MEIAGLTFKTQNENVGPLIQITISTDYTILTTQEGVKATDDRQNLWESRTIQLDNKQVIAFLPNKKESTPPSRPIDWRPRSAFAGCWVMYGGDGIAYQIMGDPHTGHQADGIRIEMVFDRPPSVTVATDEKGKKFLRLPFAVEKRKMAGKLVITTPEDTGGDFLIPACTLTTQTFDNPKLSLLFSKFQDYPGDFGFNIQVEQMSSVDPLKIDDMDFFSDGSEHHIYGHVKLFGATITNLEKAPLVLRLSGDRYEYVSGKGTATTADGQTLTFGN